MSSLLKISVSLFFVFLFTLASGDDPYLFRAGAGEAGMGYASITGKSFWSSFHNQAILSDKSSFAAGFNYTDRFGLGELSTKTAGLIVPAGKASLGGTYSYSGYKDYSRHAAGLGCGLKLSEKLSAGAQIDYFSEITSGEYQDHESITFEIGILLSPAENVMIGVHLFNPLPESLVSSGLPSGIRAGAGVDLNNSLFASAQAELTTGRPLLFRTGFEYEAFKKFMFRGGFCTCNSSFSFGTGYKLDFVQLDLSFATHDKLGVTSSVSMIFIIK